MELPRRIKGDEFAKDGKFGEVVRSIASRPGLADIPVVCFYPFDFRTRLIPFRYYDWRVIPAGVRAIATTFYEAGFTRTRAVFQLWTPNVRPSGCRIDGRPPQIIALTTMQIHAVPSYQFIADAWSMGADRPLILAGGPKAIYEPDHCFGLGANGDIHADVAATGEELVLAELLDLLTANRAAGETMLAAFRRCRDAGMLDSIPGLVYMSRERDSGGRPVLIDTGPQRLVRDLDELPHPRIGFGLMEPPHKRRTLAPRPLAEGEIHKHTTTAALVITHGCRFGCQYCPIPAYNQWTWRHKSPERLVDEMKVLREQLGLSYFFGTDDNFFNNRHTAEGFFTAMARAQFSVGGRTKKAGRTIHFSTEATEADVWRNRDLIPLAREAGTWALWFGVEDLSAELINKGQTPEKTKSLFRELTRHSILAMVMMMYFDGQPLRTAGPDMRGLLNQTRFLRATGAASYQCTLHSPSVGAREFEDTFRSGTVLRTVDNQPIPDAFFDGNHVVASKVDNPVRIHWNMLLSYLTFYNPVNLVRVLFRRPSKDPLSFKKAFMQTLGLVSLAVSFVKSLPWLFRMGSKRIKYWDGPPASKFPIRRFDAPGALKVEPPGAPAPTTV